MEILEKRPYKHFKGNLYYVHSLLKDVDSDEVIVSYQALYYPYAMFARTLKSFAEEIDVQRIDNITKQQYRFELFDSSK